MLHSPAGLDIYALAAPIELFALGDAGINNATVGVRTGRGELIWKIYQTGADQRGLQYEHDLLARLGALGLPFSVPVPLAARNGATLTLGPHGWQALFWRIAGAPADRRDRGQVQAAGAALGLLHTALARLPARPHPILHGHHALGRIHPLLPRPASLAPSDLGLDDDAGPVLEAWRDEIAVLERFVPADYLELPQQIVHGDFACANVLWDAGRVSAIIDFEFAMPDARAIDLATLIDLVARPWEGQPNWTLAEAACRGYAEHVPLLAAERATLPMLIRLRGVNSAIWWIGRDRAAGRPLDPARILAVVARRAWLERDGARLAAL
jgi:homoserine kinase type II